MIHVPLASSNDQITASLIAPILPSEIKDFLEEVDQPEACLGFFTLYVRWMFDMAWINRADQYNIVGNIKEEKTVRDNFTFLSQNFLFYLLIYDVSQPFGSLYELVEKRMEWNIQECACDDLLQATLLIL
ncbi:hypothetical protein ACJX0J_014375 [Zea mays]